MLARLLEFSIRQRALVFLGALLLAGAGFWSALRLPIDAVPDITPVQVQVNTQVPALAPEEIEKLVTVPIESEMGGIAGVTELRSLSRFGLSQVTLLFADGTDVYRARQLVSERLQNALEELPAGLTPRLAPISTGLGEIFYYVVDYAPEATNRPATRDAQLMELKQIHDYVIKPRLRATPGLAEVNATGGYDKQFVVQPDPQRLHSYGLTFSEVAEVIGENVENAGGSVIQVGGESVAVRAAGRVQSADEIAALPLRFGAGVQPVRVRDVAEVAIGKAVRTGAATYNGEEVVLGAALMLAGENSRIVARAVGQRLREIQTKLPPGIQILPVYDRTDLVDGTIRTVRNNLFEGAIMVVVVLFVLLGNWRAALIVALAIPLSMLFAMTGMVHGRVSGNLMSLGAIDFGLIVDGSVVMVENILRHLTEQQRRLGRRLGLGERVTAVLASAKEVVNPMFFGVLIITVVYVPILALGGIEGKMFHPMAITVILALTGSLILALTLMPALCVVCLGGKGLAGVAPVRQSPPHPALDPESAQRGRPGRLARVADTVLKVSPGFLRARLRRPGPPRSGSSGRENEARGHSPSAGQRLPEAGDRQSAEDDTWLMRAAKVVYRPVLAFSLRFRWGVVAVAAGLFALAVATYQRLGAEFVPQLDEGSFATHFIRATSIGIDASIEMQQRAERVILEKFPEVRFTFARLGTAEIATDPMGVNVADTYMMLQPRRQWRTVNGRRITKDELADLMTRELGLHVPGEAHLFSQPIEMRFNEILEGTRADLAVKVLGDDFAVLAELGSQVREILEAIPGAADVQFDALGRTPLLEIIPRREAMSRYNLHAAEVNRVVTHALAGQEVGTIIEGNRRTPIVVRLAEALRHQPAEHKRLPVRLDGGGLLPLGSVAELRMGETVAAITREYGQRSAAVLVNLRGRDIESFVRQAQEEIAAGLTLPPGYTLEFGGQFRNLIEAKRRLTVVVPLALLLILSLIYLTFRSARQTLLIFLCVPLAVTGGVFALWLRGLPFSISAAVGFIALSGIAVLNGLMIVTFFNQLRERGADLRSAVWDGSLLRLRPKLMTALVASLGFVPMAVATGAGAEVQRPLATVVIGGIITSTFLTLVLLPTLYEWLERRAESRTPKAE